jgi:hypothetical protein
MHVVLSVVSHMQLCNRQPSSPVSKRGLMATKATSLTTSTPGLRNTKMGVPGELSWKLRSKSYGWLVTYLAPIMLVTNLRIAAVRRSGRRARKRSKRSNSGMRFQSPGSGSSSAKAGNTTLVSYQFKTTHGTHHAAVVWIRQTS